MPGKIKLDMTKQELERAIDRAYRFAFTTVFNIVFAIIFAYLTYLIVPNIQMAIGQFVTFMFLAVRNTLTIEAGLKTLATVIPTALPATLKVGRARADISWQDEDGKATARPMLTKYQKQILNQASATSPEIEALIYTNRATSTTAVQIASLSIVPASFIHSTLRPASALNVTNLFILANTAAFLWSANFNWDYLLKMPPFMLINAGASLGVVDQPWRLLSSCFLHLAWWHLLLNMLGLMLFGYLCEGKLGRLRYTILYFFCCLGGSLASAAAFGGTTSAAGASGAIMGLAGFLTALTYFRGDLYRSVVVKQILISASDIAIIALLYGFVFNDFMSGSMTDNAGHTGGFVAGMLAAFILPRAINKRQLAGRFIAASLSILLAAGLWTIAQSKYFEDGGHGARAILAMARGDNACARAEFDQALAAEKSLELAPTDQIQGAKATPAVMQAAFKNALGSLLGFDRRRKLSELYNSASWGKSTVGDYSEAIALADRSLSYSEDPAALDTRAVACMGAKRYPQARRDLQRALVLRPGYGASAFHLAQLNLLDRPQKQTSQGRLKSEQHQRFDYDPETWEYQFGKP